MAAPTMTLKNRFGKGNHLQSLAYHPSSSMQQRSLAKNVSFAEIPKRGKQLRLGFIDDILYGAQSKTAKENAVELEQLLARAEKWRERHGAQFEKSKYVLIHFTRNRSTQVEATVTVGGTTIHPSSEAKYLGVTFDQKLKFPSHIERIVAKGTKYAFAIAGRSEEHTSE